MKTKIKSGRTKQNKMRPVLTLLGGMCMALPLYAGSFSYCKSTKSTSGAGSCVVGRGGACGSVGGGAGGRACSWSYINYACHFDSNPYNFCSAGICSGTTS